MLPRNSFDKKPASDPDKRRINCNLFKVSSWPWRTFKADLKEIDFKVKDVAWAVLDQKEESLSTADDLNLFLLSRNDPVRTKRGRVSKDKEGVLKVPHVEKRLFQASGSIDRMERVVTREPKAGPVCSKKDKGKVLFFVWEVKESAFHGIAIRIKENGPCLPVVPITQQEHKTRSLRSSNSHLENKDPPGALGAREMSPHPHTT